MNALLLLLTLAGTLPDRGIFPELLARVNATGDMFISHAVLGGRYVLRLAVGQMQTTEEDVRLAWEVLRKHSAGL